MPDPDLVDLIDGLLKNLHVGPDQRALLYRQLLERQLTARGAVSDRIGSEHQPLEQRDFMERTLKSRVDVLAARDIARRAASRRLDVRVHIYDSTSAIHPATGNAVAEKVANQLTHIDDRAGNAWAGHLKRLGATFDVRWTRHEPSAAAKAKMLPLEYPLYVLSDDKQAVRPLQIADEHHLPKVVPGSTLNIRDHIRNEWGGSLRGTSAAPGRGTNAYRKCAFLKTSIVKEGNGDSTLIANAALHELGHLFNILAPREYAHPTDSSVMRSGRGTSDMMSAVFSFNTAHARDILQEIARQWGIWKRF